jgi:hypothetical protein
MISVIDQQQTTLKRDADHMRWIRWIEGSELMDLGGMKTIQFDSSLVEAFSSLGFVIEKVVRVDAF